MSDPNILRLVVEVLAIVAGVAITVSIALRRMLQSNEAIRAQYEKSLEVSRQQLEADQKEAESRLELKLQALDQRAREEESRLKASEAELAEREKALEARELELSSKIEMAETELARISGLSSRAAKEQLLAKLEQQVREDSASHLKKLELALQEDVVNRAKRKLLQVMERTNAEYVTEATVAVVTLPNDEMKGRLIGREGRNIRSFEQLTGVDLIIDETPEAVLISSFDPLRREVARLALMNLMIDGRIHPGRIEELVEKAQSEVEQTVQEAGDRAAERAGVSGLPAKITESLGRLRFRASLGQNVLDHSVEVSQLAAMLAAEMGLNVELARRAGLLHDIGKGLPPEWEGPHALAGMEYLRQFDFRESVLNAVGAHHREIEPATPEAEIVIIADSLSAARPGARRENLDNYVKRLANLEALANEFPGVERSFAVQAGRELRVLVVPDEVSDERAAQLASEIAKRIEAELDYPGQIKVTVIRETRIQEIAK